MKTLLAAIFTVCAVASAFAAQVQCTLSWQDNSTNEDGFGIERSTPAAVEFGEISRVGVNVRTFVDPGLRSNTTYSYRVFAFNSVGQSTRSNTATITTPSSPNTAPSVTGPANTTINQGVPNSGALVLTLADAETLPANLDITITSTNVTLVPVANVVLGGSGANRTVTVTPVPGLTGSSTIGLDVGDGALRTSRTFVFTVVPFVPAPSALQLTSP